MHPKAELAPPFPQSEALDLNPLGLEHSAKSPLIFEMSLQHIPGDPAISLEATDVDGYLHKQLDTPLLATLDGHLWAAAKKSGSHIDPLNHQQVKGRNIIACEDPNLHLVWKSDTIFIKPLPQCLLNYDFWVAFLTPTTKDKQEAAAVTIHAEQAKGFLRSYSHLITSPLDFSIAQEAHLVPKNITWIQFRKFIMHFRDLGDDQVSKRHHYGQIRLSRLNLVAFITTKKVYHLPYACTGQFVAHVSSVSWPVLVILLASLYSMKSMSTAESDAVWAISVFCMVLSAIFFFLIGPVTLAWMMRELAWGFKHRHD